MVNQRNRIIELKKYIQSFGIDINIGKTKARGHKGIFMHSFNNFRIDVSKNLDEESTLSVLLHEFAHYIHYSYDSTLKNLDFMFGNVSDDLMEELIKITVFDVPKDFASALYEKKNALHKEIKLLNQEFKQIYPEFKLSEKNKIIEKDFNQTLKYLLRYDRVKIYNKIYSVETLDKDFKLSEIQKQYIILKSKQRCLRRINLKINKLNKYYNNPTELFARFFDMYYTKPERVKIVAPIAYAKMKNSKIPQIRNLELILNG